MLEGRELSNCERTCEGKHKYACSRVEKAGIPIPDNGTVQMLSAGLTIHSVPHDLSTLSVLSPEVYILSFYSCYVTCAIGHNIIFCEIVVALVTMKINIRLVWRSAQIKTWPLQASSTNSLLSAASLQCLVPSIWFTSFLTAFSPFKCCIRICRGFDSQHFHNFNFRKRSTQPREDNWVVT